MPKGTALTFPSGDTHQPSLVERFARNRFVLGGSALALLAAGLAWQWSWLVALGVAPLLLSTAPCIAMCALGLCMRRMDGRAGGTGQDGPITPTTQSSVTTQQEK
jgi:hypothetical protein